jgi:hypothetical protein
MKNTKTKQSSIARFEALTDAQKEAEVAEFDQEFVFEKSRPLNASERRDWNKFKKKVKSRKPVALVAVELDRKLVDASDKLAESQGLSRAELIDRSLRAALSFAGK